MDNKSILTTSIISITLVCLAGIIHDYKLTTKENIVNDTIYVNQIDTVYKTDSVLIKELNDSITVLNEKLFVTNYKLERVKYYNTIAAKGNNIKFLRGWINRVLND